MPLATNCPITLTTHPWQFSITLRRVGADGGGSFPAISRTTATWSSEIAARSYYVMYPSNVAGFTGSVDGAYLIYSASPFTSKMSPFSPSFARNSTQWLRPLDCWCNTMERWNLLSCVEMEAGESGLYGCHWLVPLNLQNWWSPTSQTSQRPRTWNGVSGPGNSIVCAGVDASGTTSRSSSFIPTYSSVCDISLRRVSL